MYVLPVILSSFCDAQATIQGKFVAGQNQDTFALLRHHTKIVCKVLLIIF